jgi:hypothetical protein
MALGTLDPRVTNVAKRRATGSAVAVAMRLRPTATADVAAVATLSSPSRTSMSAAAIRPRRRNLAGSPVFSFLTVGPGTVAHRLELSLARSPHELA